MITRMGSKKLGIFLVSVSTLMFVALLIFWDYPVRQLVGSNLSGDRAYAASHAFPNPSSGPYTCFSTGVEGEVRNYTITGQDLGKSCFAKSPPPCGINAVAVCCIFIGDLANGTYLATGPDGNFSWSKTPSGLAQNLPELPCYNEGSIEESFSYTDNYNYPNGVLVFTETENVNAVVEKGQEIVYVMTISNPHRETKPTNLQFAMPTGFTYIGMASGPNPNQAVGVTGNLTWTGTRIYSAPPGESIIKIRTRAP